MNCQFGSLKELNFNEQKKYTFLLNNIINEVINEYNINNNFEQKLILLYNSFLPDVFLDKNIFLSNSFLEIIYKLLKTYQYF